MLELRFGLIFEGEWQLARYKRSWTEGEDGSKELIC
jgi:hypothetical protein